MDNRNLPWYSFYPTDYRRDTDHLTMLEDCAYRRLLDYYYATGKPLPNSVERCILVARALAPAEQEAVRVILSMFFVKQEDGYHSLRADKEIAKAEDIFNKKSGAGKVGGSATSTAKVMAARANGQAGGRPRKTQPNPTENPTETQSNSNQNPTPSHIQEPPQEQEQNTHTQTATKTQSKSVCVSPSKPSNHVLKWVPTEMHSTKWKDGEQPQLAKLEQQHGPDKLVCGVEQYWIAQPDPDYFSKTVFKWTDFLDAAEVWLDKVTPEMIAALKIKQWKATPEGKAEYERNIAAQLAQARKADGDKWDSMTKPNPNLVEETLAEYMALEETIPAEPLEIIP